ncbi:MAG: stage 0 sporulation family protein [Candidatus Zixiibacteriota bacterium]
MDDQQYDDIEQPDGSHQPAETPPGDEVAGGHHDETHPCYLVEFKGSRKEYYRDPYHLPVKIGDDVIVQVERGEDIGRVIQHISEDKIEREKLKALPILRIANAEERARSAENRQKEFEAREVCRKMAADRNLNMKVVDAEWQFDGNKITFYFTAEKRVDFRQLVKDLAGTYRTRIELRQIGARDEARRVGGIGICGYEQCCTLFLKEFEPITTQLAREQSLSLNPAKISGNCGRLLCCLRYESGYYREASKQYPKVGTEWVTAEGKGIISSVQILKEQMTVSLPEGKQEPVSLTEIRRQQRKKKSWFE